MPMGYTVDQIKVFAYNRDEKEDFDIFEKNLFLGLSYCYDCFKAGYSKEQCQKLMNEYIFIFNQQTFIAYKANKKRGDNSG